MLRLFYIVLVFVLVALTDSLLLWHFQELIQMVRFCGGIATFSVGCSIVSLQAAMYSSPQSIELVNAGHDCGLSLLNDL
jgi:hypothetical protein